MAGTGRGTKTAKINKAQTTPVEEATAASPAVHAGETHTAEQTPAAHNEGMKITLQVGAELRVRNNGDVIMDNPGIELANEQPAADATILYRFDARAGEHIFRLLEPVANHQHTKVHRWDD
jgi:hypothetical protein